MEKNDEFINPKILCFKLGCTCLIIFFLVCCETPQSLTKKRIRDVENGLLKSVVFKGEKPEKMKLTERMQYYKVPGVSLAVIDKLQVEWAKGCGVSEITSNDPVTPDSLFQAGDLSQPVAAMGVLRLVEKGELELDRDVNSYLKSWRIPLGRLTRKNKVTLRRLLSHTSGLVALDYDGHDSDEELPSLPQVLRGEAPSHPAAAFIACEPGSEQRYSEAGYAVLQLIVEEISGRPFSDFMSAQILGPLELRTSAFSPHLPSRLEPLAVSGHDREGQPLEGKALRYPASAASGLWSTPADLARFTIDLIRSAVGEQGRVVSTSMAREMLTPQSGNRGFGFIVEDEGVNLHLHLQGRTAGFSCALVAYPSRQQGVVVMTNSDNGIYLIEEILRSVSEAYGWPHYMPEIKTYFRLDPSVYQEYVGQYEVRPDYILSVTHQDCYLIIQPTGQAPTQFFVDSMSTFFSTDPYIEIRFNRDKDGRVTGLTLTQRDFTVEAKKIS